MLGMRTRWCGWGDPAMTFSLDSRPKLWPALVARLGDPGPQGAALSLEDVVLPPSRLSQEDLVRLAAAAGGAGNISTDHEARVRHALGKSYRDLVRLRLGQVPHPPDAVAFPESHEAVKGLLAEAARLGLAVVPFGGGTSVTGGVEGPDRPYLVLALSLLNRVLEVDRSSRVARVQAGILGPELEARLGQDGLTLGHFPQSFVFSTLGGWIATRSAGQQSTRYGKIEDMVVALRLATPQGDIATPPLPAASDGPDLNRFLAGSEGTCGIITEATVRVRPVPPDRDYQGFLMPTFGGGIRAIQALVQGGGCPATVRLSDSVETEATFLMRQAEKPGPKQLVGSLLKRLIGPLDGRCLLILGCEGTSEEIDTLRSEGLGTFRHHGGVKLGGRVGREWYAHRFDLPYLRDVLLDRGIMVDTLETSGLWSKLEEIHLSVGDAISRTLAAWGTPGWVFCHVSHAYEVGASLYFTMLARQDRERPIEQWWAAKQAATEAMLRNGGALSHHHGIGRDHAGWLEAEIGPVGRRLIVAARNSVDPGGVLNPGILTGEA